MTKRRSGFTIVELLIVIVVIAILATISIVAYNGIQERAKNTQTVSAVRQWVQALKMYKADHGSYPSAVVCLGSGYGRGFTGNEASGGECRQDSASGGDVNTSSGFINVMMADYLKGNPTPAFVTAGSAAFPWYRGAYFYQGYTGSKDRIDFVLAGSSIICPPIAGMTMSSGTYYASTNSVRCSAYFPDSPY